MAEISELLAKNKTTGKKELYELKDKQARKFMEGFSENVETVVNTYLDEKNITSDIVQANNKLNSIGAMEKIKSTSAICLCLNEGVKKDIPLKFKAISCTESTITGLNVYGVYGEKTADGYDLIMSNIAFGISSEVIPKREYHHIQVAIVPYNATKSVEFEFEILQFESTTINESINQLNNNIDLLQTVVASGFFQKKSSGVIIDCEVEKNAKYKAFAWDINGVDDKYNPRCYLFNTDGTYHEIFYQLNGATKYYSITTDEDSDHIRLYMNKSSDCDEASCNWAIVNTGKRLGIIEEKLDNMQSFQSLNRTTCNIFRKVVCCGDSYTAGYIVDSNGTAHTVNEGYAFPHYMETLTGNTWVNCGHSGANVLTWQTAERGLPKAQAQGKAQAYVIGLMINDVSSSDRAVELGTADDIGTENATYYGGMATIIRELSAISPEAKIFVNTCPKTGTKYTEYNEAVRNIVEAYKDTYNVHCIDLEKYKDLYENTSLTRDALSGHYTAIGYEQFAEIYAYILSKYINENISDFQDVAFIEYDE